MSRFFFLVFFLLLSNNGHVNSLHHAPHAFVNRRPFFIIPAKENSQENYTTDKRIFILAGQSNMAGRGGVCRRKWNGCIPIESWPDPSILRLNADLQWEQAHEPLHADIDFKKTCGVGPGMAFANTVVEASDGIVGLVPCAVGGTKIREWGRGKSLYENMVRRAKASVKEGGSIEAVLWYQGETDTVSLADAESYKGNMEKLIRDLRSDLELPTLPVIQVGLASAEGPFIRKVRRAQMSINLPNVTWVDAMGLPLLGDCLHLSTQAQVELGKMLGDSYLKNFAAAAQQ